jgi:hypothetical protein
LSNAYITKAASTDYLITVSLSARFLLSSLLGAVISSPVLLEPMKFHLQDERASPTMLSSF